MWALSGDWYTGRLEVDFGPPAKDHLQGLLTAVGLDTGFWQLP